MIFMSSSAYFVGELFFQSIFIMKKSTFILVSILSVIFVSCVESEKKITRPTSDRSKMPWNTPIAGQGQGQFGMLPGSQDRR